MYFLRNVRGWSVFFNKCEGAKCHFLKLEGRTVISQKPQEILL